MKKTQMNSLAMRQLDIVENEETATARTAILCLNSNKDFIKMVYQNVPQPVGLSIKSKHSHLFKI